MTTSLRQFDRANLEAEVFHVARELLTELGSRAEAGAIRGSAHLDRDLGLGSLERVELLVRIGKAFSTEFPEGVVAEADTLDDVIDALAKALGAAPSPEIHPAPQHGATRPTQARGAAEELASAETWQEVLRYRARTDAGRAHLILWENGREARRICFDELHAGAERVAAQLAQRGITRGDAVALMLPTSAEFFEIFAGTLLTGGVPVPIYPPVRADRIAEYAARQSAILRNAQARLLVTFREAAPVARLLGPRVRSLRGVVTAATLAGSEAPHTEGFPSLPVRGRADDLALLQYTSGSTGDPKGVMLTHANLLANVRAMGQAIGVQPDDAGVSWLPLYHDMGLIGAWLMPLYFGLPVTLLSPMAFLTRPAQWLRAIHCQHGTLTAAPNFAYELAARKITDAEIEGVNLSSMRAAFCGAEPVSAETLERFAARFASHGLRREALTPVYGLAEASLAVTVPPPGRGPRVDRIVREIFEREGRAVPVPRESSTDEAGALSFVSVGAAVPEHEVRIVDASGKETGERAEGVLWLRGPSTTSGYFRNPQASRTLFPEGHAAGWINSGDRAYRADGEIFITGRVKDIILKAGRNLYPQEIEELAGRVQGVRKGCVAAFGVTDAATGTERLVIVAETRERDGDARKSIAGSITEQVTEAIGLPPDVVELLPPRSIPKTSSGKLRRDHTRRLYLAGTLGSAAPPRWLQIARLGAASGTRAAGSRARRALEGIYGIWAVTVFALLLVPTWLIVRLTPSRRAAARVTLAGLRLCLALIGCRVKVTGRENLVAPPQLLVSNHTSYADVLIVMAALGLGYRFVAKGEIRHMPFMGTFLRKLGHFAFNRSDRKERLRQAEEIEQALRSGESVFVFPEGTFTAQEGVRPFHLGAFKAALESGCPVQPVALRGTRHFLRDGTFLPRPSRITLTICPALKPSASGASWTEIVRVRDTVRQTIARNANEPLL
jgi:1-acyl-sn-glycerol-3-phosphate acyltransferase